MYLDQSVKQNIERFPNDFMFELTKSEWTELITNCDKLPENIKHNPSPPFAFIEQGVAMLSGILRSPVAVRVNINIMRAFVALRECLFTNTKSEEIKELRNRIINLEQHGATAFKMIERVGEENMEAINDFSEYYRKELDDIYLALSQLADKQKVLSKPRNPIGFHIPEKEIE
ncbi:hypothetical protein EZS27_030872 [termite gut metagenome]|uniref:KilA-N DNA-binding domain-containing protein n=1 Tax=termite gut metagenome TaxID=433724 RepID=A0A5J4QDR8_9ZZZZ